MALTCDALWVRGQFPAFLKDLNVETGPRAEMLEGFYLLSHRDDTDVHSAWQETHLQNKSQETVAVAGQQGRIEL